MNENSRHEPGLFDLPIEAPPPGPPGELEGEAGREEGTPSEPEIQPLFDLRATSASAHSLHVERVTGRASGGSMQATGAQPGPRAVPGPTGPLPGAPLSRRLRGAFGDLLILASAGVLAATGAHSLGSSLAPEKVPALLLFVVAFSFLYTVIPLAFWGETPGMAWAGLVARARGVEPLSFGQTVLRWFGTWLTWLLLGLPGLLALGGRSLADRMSDSRTYESAALSS